MIKWSTIIGILCCPLLAGCGGDDELALVEGEITFRGKPARAQIMFQLLRGDERRSGRPSYGYTDSAGHYKLQYSQASEGALVGPHLVVITVYSESSAEEDYSSPKRPLRSAQFFRRVESGEENVFHFDLTD